MCLVTALWAAAGEPYPLASAMASQVWWAHRSWNASRARRRASLRAPVAAVMFVRLGGAGAGGVGVWGGDGLVVGGVGEL